MTWWRVDLSFACVADLRDLWQGFQLDGRSAQARVNGA
jgi:hypothetical protein